MGDGLLGGVLGEEAENPEIESAGANAATEAFAAAVAAKLAGNDPQVAQETVCFLRKQAQLLETQNRHLEGEYAARLHLLQGQAAEVDLRRFGLRLRVAFQLFLALAVTALGAAAILFVHDAATSRRVVIDPFRSPAGFPTRGVDGEVLASGLLDELTRLQNATRSTSAARNLTGAWANDIKVDVPETGVSIGEISRLLTRRFGKDVHIDGDLTETASGGLELTVRGDGVPPRNFTGGLADLQHLLVAAAEYVYSKSQPARWSAYLNNVGRDQETIAFVAANLTAVEPSERPKLLNAWAIALQNTGGSPTEALSLFRAAVRLQPDYWTAHQNVQNSLLLLGKEEDAWLAAQEMTRIAGGRPGRAPEEFYNNLDLLTWNVRAMLLANLASAEATEGVGTSAVAAGTANADFYARLHDPEAAELALKTTLQDPHDPTIAAMTHFVRGRLASERGDHARAAEEMRAFGVAFKDPIVASNYAGYDCWIAPELEAVGQKQEADDLLRSAGAHVDCYRFRADILNARGDWAGAQRAYAAAVALAPDLPAAYYSWGVALQSHGDLATAATKFKAAHERGPHWADPLKVWGDELFKQGEIAEARAKYDEAVQYAPNWKELKAARAALAKRST